MTDIGKYHFFIHLMLDLCLFSFLDNLVFTMKDDFTNQQGYWFLRIPGRYRKIICYIFGMFFIQKKIELKNLCSNFDDISLHSFVIGPVHVPD